MDINRKNNELAGDEFQRKIEIKVYVNDEKFAGLIIILESC